MKKLLDFLRAGAFCASSVALVLLALLFGYEESGRLRARIERELSDRLGEPVEVEAAHLRWFRPSVELHGLSFGDRESFWVESLSATLWRTSTGIGVSQLQVTGGRIVMSDDLADRLRRITESAVPRDDRKVALPTIVVRDLQVDLSHPEWGDLPIGLVDVLCTANESGSPHIEGRIVPNLAQGEGPSEIYLSGYELEEGLIEITGSTEGVSVTVDTLPEGTVLEVFREYAPRGNLVLDGRVRFSLDGSRPPSGVVRAALTEASVLPPTTDAPVEDLRIDLTASFDPTLDQDFTVSDAWRSSARVRARWNGAPVEGWVFFGRNAGPGLAAAGWLQGTHLPVDDGSPAIVGAEEVLRIPWNALEPRGEAAEVVISARFPEDGTAELSVEVAADGNAGISYHGWPNENGDTQGVPLPVEQVSGHLLILHSQEQPISTRIAWFDAGGHHSGFGPNETAFSEGMVVVGTEEPRQPRLDLRYGGSDVPIDERARIALQGLDNTDFIWPMFAPSAGRASFEAHMMSGEATGGRLASHFAFALDDLTASYRDLPVGMSGIEGRLELLFNPDRFPGIGFDLTGRSGTSDEIRIRGRLMDDPRTPERAIEVSDVDVAVANVALRGADRDVVVERIPAVGVALEEMGASGKVDLSYRGCVPAAGAEMEHYMEFTPRQVRLLPRRFKVQTRNAIGRALISAYGAGVLQPQADDGGEPAAFRVHTRVQPLVGDWASGTVVAMAAELDSHADGHLRLFGAGLDPSNRVLVGALGEAFSAVSASTGGGMDLAALAIEGRVDLTGEIDIPVAGLPVDRYRLHLRDNDFATGPDERFAIRHLKGVLEERDEVLQGEGITAVLGTTPILLETTRFAVGEDGAYRAELAPRARQLPLDLDHLGLFLDEPTVEALLEELDWRGEIDVDDARILITGRAGETGRLEFGGRVTPHNMSVNLGLPMEVDAASVHIESLVLEDGTVRAWMTVDDLEGRLADRRLSDTSMALTYVAPHLSVLALDGELEGGRVHNLAGEAAPAFSLDLQDPFQFDLAVRLSDVDVAGLLHGLFESEFASRGILDAELRLRGDLDQITGIRGDGRVTVAESTLWSIPVMRDLFSELGFDQTAVFDEMRTRFEVSGGVISMNAMQVDSPLLRLVGEGSLDLDGSLRHDLRVQYSLVDKLGPLRRMIYFVQNNLLRVSVRGDMSRPRVVLQGALAFLQSLRKSRSRDLPLPGFAPLPERF